MCGTPCAYLPRGHHATVSDLTLLQTGASSSLAVSQHNTTQLRIRQYMTWHRTA